jgi:hypothetical protein
MRRKPSASCGITFARIEEAVSSPNFVEADPRYPKRTRSYKATAAFGGRVLRVEHRPEADDFVIIAEPGDDQNFL